MEEPSPYLCTCGQINHKNSWALVPPTKMWKSSWRLFLNHKGIGWMRKRRLESFGPMEKGAGWYGGSIIMCHTMRKTLKNIYEWGGREKRRHRLCGDTKALSASLRDGCNGAPFFSWETFVSAKLSSLSDCLISLICFYSTALTLKGQCHLHFPPLETCASREISLGSFSAKPKIHLPKWRWNYVSVLILERASYDSTSPWNNKEVQKGTIWERQQNNRATEPASSFWFPNLTGLFDLAQTSAGSVHTQGQLQKHCWNI